MFSGTELGRSAFTEDPVVNEQSLVHCGDLFGSGGVLQGQGDVHSLLGYELVGNRIHDFRGCRIDGIEWIRLHYAYPAAFPDDVIEVMASEPKICKYLDIPFQHISDAQLASMHRRHTKAEAMELIRRLRGAIPDLALRTTLLVGYPGETEEDFAELMEFVREVRFERLGVFAYSEEEGTYSARELHDDVPDAVKQERVERIMALQLSLIHISEPTRRS